MKTLYSLSKHLLECLLDVKNDKVLKSEAAVCAVHFWQKDFYLRVLENFYKSWINLKANICRLPDFWQFVTNCSINIIKDLENLETMVESLEVQNKIIGRASYQILHILKYHCCWNSSVCREKLVWWRIII